MIVGAAAATVGTGPQTAAGPDVVGELPLIAGIDRDPAHDVSRSRSSSTAPSPAVQPVPTQDAELSAVAGKPASGSSPEAVPGCDAVIPGEGEVENGRLTDEYLCRVGQGHKLRPDAAAAFVALAEAYDADRGRSLLDCVTDSYRSYEQQVDLKARKPYLAAAPGTSNHGWGVAIDLACGMDSYDSSLYGWLAQYGGDFGWENPPWAQPSGSKPEPWHWEYSP